MSERFSITSKINPIELFKRYSYDVGSAICEFIDNSIANFEKNEHILAKSSDQPKLQINIIYDVSSHFSQKHSLIIEDNALGMTVAKLKEGLIIQNPSLIESGGNLNKYGVGMKSAIFWLGDSCEIETSQLNTEGKCFVYLNADTLTKEKGLVVIRQKFEANDKHYTVINVSNLQHTFDLKSLRDVVKKIQITYAHKLKQVSKIEIRVCKKKDLIYSDIPEKNEESRSFNSCQEIPPITHKKRNIWINDKTQKPYRWEINDCVLDQENVYDFTGYFAIDEKVDQDSGGVYLYLNERLIEVLAPGVVFGKGNPFRKIFAELECRGDWLESQAKDKILWQGNLQNKLLTKFSEFLKKNHILRIASDLRDEKKLDLTKMQEKLDKQLSILPYDPHGIEVELSLDKTDQVFSLQPQDTGWLLKVYIEHPFLLQWLKNPGNKINELIAIIFLFFSRFVVSITDKKPSQVQAIIDDINNFLALFIKSPKKINPPSSNGKLKPNTPDDGGCCIFPSDVKPFDETGQKNLPSKDFFHEFIKPPSDEEKAKRIKLQSIVQVNEEKINRILYNNNVQKARVSKHFIGAQIVHYQIKCEDNIAKILKLENEFKSKLGEERIYFHTVVAGTSSFGIDVPIQENLRTPVFWSHFAEQLRSDNKNALSFLIGQNVDKTIEKLSFGHSLPHLLIAGSTGQGKSVTLLSIIASLLFLNSPQDLQLLLIDVKRVEMSAFRHLPHLRRPVVTEPDQTEKVLQEMIEEINHRFLQLEKRNLSNIADYNSSLPSNEQKIPNIVIIIDEFADLILQKRSEIENKIVRICQIGRAAGVHLILSTQRPSVDVVSSLIKANVQGRIALATTNRYNSQVILDLGGAEKLLGKGDMLCIKTGQEPKRLQGFFIDTPEITKLVNFWKKANF